MQRTLQLNKSTTLVFGLQVMHARRPQDNEPQYEEIINVRATCMQKMEKCPLNPQHHATSI